MTDDRKIALGTVKTGAPHRSLARYGLVLSLASAVLMPPTWATAQWFRHGFIAGMDRDINLAFCTATPTESDLNRVRAELGHAPRPHR